ATLQKAFDPFFTTKAQGKGTGLGLSTVYGIAKQHGGYITAYSEPGHGTTFRIYFPVHGAPMAEASKETARQENLFGTETILVVEDQSEVRDLIVNILKGYGYTVLEAADGQEALRKAQSYPGTIHILVTDIILPDANGKDLHRQLEPLREGMKVLYMSGYTADVISSSQLLQIKGHFIQKPFSLHDFLSRLRQAIEDA
ncbi:MAG TPA: response regulator, partial [Deltaproteobacteria bacterium]|nr:response regulator [Deltaproteobacteria bacterium]